jgi:hypothetical protein
MLPPAQLLARRHAAFCLKFSVPWRDCRSVLDEAVALAGELSRDQPLDEPAALLFALNAQIRALGNAWEDFPIAEARRLARSHGLELALKVGDVDFENLRLHLLDPNVTRRGTYEELRDFIAARLSPLHLRIVR